MQSVYSIIQYFPDLVTGECVNIGVIAVEEEGRRGCYRLLRNWSRVNNFVGGLDVESDVSYLVDWLDSLFRQAKQGDGHLIISTPRASIERMIGSPSPYSSIQFTPFRGSIRPYTELCDEVAERFLVEGTSDTWG